MRLLWTTAVHLKTILLVTIRIAPLTSTPRISRSGSDGTYETVSPTTTARSTRDGRASSIDDIHEENEYDEVVAQTQGLFNIERSGNSWLIADRLAAVERGKLLTRTISQPRWRANIIIWKMLRRWRSIFTFKKLRRVFELVHGISSQLLEMASRMNDKLKARNRWPAQSSHCARQEPWLERQRVTTGHVGRHVDILLCYRTKRFCTCKQRS